MKTAFAKFLSFFGFDPTFWTNPFVLAITVTWSGVAGFALQMVESQVKSQGPFVAAFAVVVIIDWILGTAVAYKNKSLSSSGARKIITKVCVYLLLLTAVHWAAHYSVDGAQNQVFDLLDNLLYMFLMGVELLSVIENCALLGVVVPTAFTKIILKRLSITDDEGNLLKDSKAAQPAEIPPTQQQQS